MYSLSPEKGSVRGILHGITTHTHTQGTLTRFLNRAVNSLVNTENFRNALPKSGSSLHTQLPPNFSRAWVYCSSFSTCAASKGRC